MAASRGPHVRELFIGVHAETAENKTQSHFKKGKNSHANLGAYKPRILSDDSTNDVIKTRTNTDTSRLQGSGINRPFIIGDKDVPMTLEPADSIYSELAELLPTSTGSVMRGPMPVSLGAGEVGTANPLFNDRSPVVSPRAYRESVHGTRSSTLEMSDGVAEMAEPAPDYDEDEVTMDFDNDTIDQVRDQPMVKEFAGEDYAKYLLDDEDVSDYHRSTQSMRAHAPIARKALIQREKASKTEPRRNDKQKRDSSKSLFRKKASTTRGSVVGTVRNYSVNDTKLGIGLDGTMRRRERRTLRDEAPQDSYESFLQTRNGVPRTGSMGAASSDTGPEEMADMFRRPTGTPFWKKLTLRIKQASGYNLRH